MGFAPGQHLEWFSVGVNLSGGLSARYAFDGVALSANISYSQALGVFPIRRYRADLVLLGVLNAQLAPGLPDLPLGFAGLALEKPRFGLNLTYDAVLGLWRQVQFSFNADFTVYDGAILTDHFGLPFQTGVFIVSPTFSLDLATSLPALSLGANITLFGPGLAYTFGAVHDWRADGTNAWRFNAGVRLR